MKLTKQRLKEIIKEEVKEHSKLEEFDAAGEQGGGPPGNPGQSRAHASIAGEAPPMWLEDYLREFALGLIARMKEEEAAAIHGHEDADQIPQEENI